MKQFSDFEKACIKQAMRKLLNGRHFCIIDFRNIGDMLGVDVRKHHNYDFLHGLHCVAYKDMEPVILKGLENKLLECFRPDLSLNADRLFNNTMAEENDFIEIEDIRPSNKSPNDKKKGFLSIFTGNKD